jgi:hypothetical protein
MVRVKGVEPPRLAAPDPKSGASANSATPACLSLFKHTKIIKMAGLAGFEPTHVAVKVRCLTAWL